MRALLAFTAASIAALALPAAPASAERFVQPGFGPTIQGSVFVSGDRGHRRHGDFRRRHRGFDGAFLYDREYQGDTAWRSDGFNDWWHDRPDRSYPRWMANNQDCQRLWWGGGTWRC